MPNIRGTLSTIAPVVFACTETWLQTHIYNSAVSVSSYVIHRCDRPCGRTGGGAALYINRLFPSIRMHPTINLEYIDCVGVHSIS